MPRRLTDLIHAISAKTAPAALVIGLLLAGVALIFRNEGLNPAVFADEFLYSQMARLTALSAAHIPSYAFSLIYRTTNACGEGFLPCARLLNSVFFIAGCALVYLTAIRVASKPVATFIALLVAVGPISTYTAYFMPEAMFFFGFWLFTWHILMPAKDEWIHLVCSAVLFGVFTLIKPHPIFLYPGLAIYFAIVTCRQPSYASWFLKWVATCSVFIAVSLGIKLGVGYLIAGPSAVTLFGSTYGGVASGTSGQAHSVLIDASLKSLLGHALIIIALFAPAVCAIAISLGRIIFIPGTPIDDRSKICAFATVVLASLIGVSALFTAAVMNLGEYESVYRVHMRYYNFALPLLLIVISAHLSDSSERNLSPLNWVIATVAVILATFGLIKGLWSYTPSFVDAPDAVALIAHPKLFSVLAVASLLLTVFWATRPQAAMAMFLFAFWPAMVALNMHYNMRVLVTLLTPDTYDRAGKFARQYLSPTERDNVFIFAPSAAGAYKTLFHIDSRSPARIEGRSVDQETLNKLLNKGQTVIAIGPDALPAHGTVALPGFAISRPTSK